MTRFHSHPATRNPIALLLLAIPVMLPTHCQGQEPAADLVDLAPPAEMANAEVIGFERQQFTVERVRGKVFIDSVETTDDVVERETQEIQLVEVFDELKFTDTREFRSWVKTLRGARTYTYDNVFLQYENGTVVTTPLVLLPPQQRALADIEWRIWIDQQRALVAQLVAQKERDDELRQAEQKRIQKLDALVQQQSANAQRLADLEYRIARESRRRAYFSRQVFIGSTGTGLGFGGNGVQFLSTSFPTSQIAGFPVQGAVFSGN